MPLLVRKPLEKDENGVRIKKDGTPAKKLGPPSKYKKSYHPQKFIDMSREGYFKPQIAAVFNIHEDTFTNWETEHSEFDAAVKMGTMLCKVWWLNLGRHSMETGEEMSKNQLTLYLKTMSQMFPQEWSEKFRVIDETPIDKQSHAQLNTRLEQLVAKLKDK